MTRLTAQQAIDSITAETIQVFGQTAQKHTTGIAIRARLQQMAEKNDISPAEYNKALKIIWSDPVRMSEAIKAAEYEELNR
ncbi:hypothetical protein [Desulfotignum phosphitoxidans]|uniref:Uncharacterized protein n=1 Tax=Desulfotignum phosphitoxidans DSM 13687 TaxID=1286635 RepID=S0FVP2_9BACT|nr:hypothetical protein [Desulfotignum phosphitoxidans]EMS77184.1 hypothetical protein Dpo_22c00030 [Desulfotignum phosphitoxidans DSM 13687]